MLQWTTASLAVLSALALLTAAAGAKSNVSKDLRIVTVDVEGGAAVLFVTPDDKSLLIDTGWPPGLGGPGPFLASHLRHPCPRAPIVLPPLPGRLASRRSITC